MKILPTTFTRSGWKFKQLAREGNIAVYEKVLGPEGLCYSLEVIKVRRRGRCVINGRVLEEAEVYPPSESWGREGWTVATKDRAFEKMAELLERK